MQTDNLTTWDRLRTPPPDALKKILGGRIAGKTDIKPQWRYEVMTHVFGMCGVGWKYRITRLWTEEGSEGQVMCFANILLFVRQGDVWGAAIPANGGSMLIEKERSGLHSNDEGFKMAITDALGTAMKMLGVAADIYRGGADRTKYDVHTPETSKPIIGLKPAVNTPVTQNVQSVGGNGGQGDVLPQVKDLTVKTGVWEQTVSLPVEFSEEVSKRGTKYWKIKTQANETYLFFSSTELSKVTNAMASGLDKVTFVYNQNKFGNTVEEVTSCMMNV